ncbi:MAG: hypothetical protein KC589_06690 [Nanoarchaeota archaeon]|nr:hypothetical protein [Nanoarchaeota archaeon]
MVKKSMPIMMFILLTIFSINSSFALTTIGPNIQIVKNEITPEPVEPGNDITLKVMITNSGDELADNVNIVPEIESPFYFKKSDFNKQDFSICGGCSYDATYYLSVNSDTISGTYPINFQIDYETGIRKEETILVKVIGVPDIMINYDKEEIHYPEENFELNLNLDNIGTGNARNIKITSLSEDFLLSGTQTKTVDILNADSQKEIKLSFQTNSNLNSGLYKIPFEITYLDELGNELKKEYDISINIKDTSSITLQNLKVEDYQTNIFDEIIITGIIENNGEGKAENVYAYVETDLEGYKKSFVGSLKADEDSPVLFKLKSSNSGDYPIKLIVSYEDDKGIHTLEENIEVKVTKPTSRLYTIIGIALLFVAIISVRYFMKRKK